ncbi:hypothetical protein SAMN03080615_02521 [Amphritea atlantica]|uniref:Uncharacterized protein n=1 Tax=Amphritea atlantica TaxID=355243 RepID=A0A1H9IF35_9GAMM|nr:hypothetical protein SAMN03080615_02521 [Amphritea atlantica]
MYNNPMHAEPGYVAQLFVVSLRSILPQKLLQSAGPVIGALAPYVIHTFSDEKEYNGYFSNNGVQAREKDGSLNYPV